MAEGPTRTSIIVGWDGSSHAEDALELGRLLSRATGARLIAAEVSLDRLGVLRGRGPREDRGEHPVAARAAGPGAARVEPRTVAGTSAGRGLHDLAEEVGAEIVVLGSTHRGSLGRVFLGTVADDLVHGAPCAVAIAPNGYAKRYANRLLNVVVVAFDASPEARAAAGAAARIAQAAGASLRVLAVHEPPPLASASPEADWELAEAMAGEEERLEREVAALVESLPPAVSPEARVVSGHPARTLAGETERDVDLLVIGSRGHGPLGRVLLGSVSSEIVRSASCPVMVVPRSASRA
jgi:nucleotide-binding universal stress UspA family protein